MKKIIAMLLTLALLLAMAPAVPAESELPAVGDVVEGFVVTEISRFEAIGADIVLFTHEKTGAELMYIANDDTNRVFEITFRTPAPNDTGVSHVFEHATLSGSEKYPSASLFFNLNYQTYSTYMNAATYNFMTTYPVASLSEAQLLAYADFYTDSCLHPIISSSESVFREEAWRYAMTDADSDLTLAGTVYSEMLGAMAPANRAYYDFMKAAFPGSTKANISGGDPARIPDLTFEELCAYHDAYYHPSNTLTCLYGSFEDYTAFLRLLNGYFSAYEKKDFNITDDGYTPIETGLTQVIPYPLEAGASAQNGTFVYYGILCGQLEEADYLALDLLTTLLTDPGSVMGQAMKDRFPTGTFRCYVDETTPEAAVVFVLQGVNEEDAESFREAVDESLAAVAADGMNPENVAAIASQVRMSTLLMGEESNLGVNLIPNIALCWALSGDVNYYFRTVEGQSRFEELNENGTYSEITGRLLLNNPRTVLSVSVPAPGLKDENDAALAAMLADRKARMTPEEIDTIVADTAARAQRSEDDSSEYVAQLQAVTVASLPEEIRLYEIDDASENGVRYLSARANVNGVSRAGLMLDASALDEQGLLAMQLYISLVGDMSTTSHDRAQIPALITRWLYDPTIKLSMIDAEDADGVHPYLRMSFTALDEDLDAGFGLLYELLFETDLSDTQLLLDTVSGMKTSTKAYLESSAYQVALYRAIASADPAMAAINYVNNLDFYEYLCAVEERLSTDPESVVLELEAARSILCNSTGAIVLCSGNDASAAAVRSAADGFLAKLGSEPIEEKVLNFPVPQTNEAIILNSAVQYNVIFAPYEALGLEEYEGAMSAVANLVLDNCLIGMLREQYGVYTILHDFNSAGAYILTYRDPNIRQTFAVFDSLADTLANMDITQEQLDNYILSSYSTFALNSGEIRGGETALLNLLDGIPQEDTLEHMRSLKSITVESFREYAGLYAALAENGIRITAGGAAAIGECADLYGSVLDPFGAANAVTPADLLEDSPYAEASLFCRSLGLMPDLSQELFGVEAPATAGDLAAAMYVAVGGSYAPEEALAFWAGYGLNLGAAEDTMSRQDLAYYGAVFLSLLGIEAAGPAPEGYADADQIADYAQVPFGFALSNGLMLPTEEGLLAPLNTATRGELARYLMGIFAE